MVKLSQNSVGSENTRENLPKAVKLSNGSCSAEATQAVLNTKENPHALNVSEVNGNAADKVSLRGMPWKCVNGKIDNKLSVNGLPTGNENYTNQQPIKETPTVNGYSKKLSVNNPLTVIGNSSKSAYDAPTVSENSVVKETANEAPPVNGNSGMKVSANDIPTVKNNCGNDSPVEAPMLNGKCNDEGSGNYSNTPQEIGNCSNDHVSDSLSKEDLRGFIEVVNKKKRNKNRPKNHRMKQSSNLPPGQNAASIRRDNGNDKKLGEKASSPTHVSQKPLNRNFAAIRSSEKSYSSALVNGQVGNSPLKNSVSNVCSDIQNVKLCANSNKSSNNCDLTGTCISRGQLSIDTTKSAVTNGTLDVKCKQSNSSTKVEMTDVSAQTDVCFPNERPPSQKECLSSEEVIEPEKSSSPIDYVDDTDFVGEITDESSNAAYSESVVSNDSGRGDSEVVYDEHMPYCCEFPQEKVKNLIGRFGCYKYEIERQTGASFWVPKNIFIDEDTTIVAFKGKESEIEKAKQIIKKRFRNVSLRQWVPINEEQWLNNGPTLSDSFSATLPPAGVNFSGVVSCIFTPHYFWLQQWGHPQMHALEDLERKMSNHFNTHLDVPAVVNPAIGNVVAVPVFIEGADVRWVRGEIINVIPEMGNVIARYLDHGGESEIPASEIRPMREEFLSIPFFAAKCSLFGILPAGDIWSEEACAEFKRLCSNCRQPPTASVIFKVSQGYFVSMRGFDEETNTRVDVADTLIRKGLAQFDYRIYQPAEPSNEHVQ